MDRQELRLPDRGLEGYAHPRAQRGLSALPGLVLSTPGRAREYFLRDADGGTECQPVWRRRFLFEELRRAWPPGRGDSRQQPLASDRVGTRTRHGSRSAGAAWRQRAQGGSGVAAAPSDPAQADLEAARPQG